MIPRDYVTEWRASAPWIEDVQVEQDLVISKALIDIFSHHLLQDALPFRGGTALYKLHLKPQISISCRLKPSLPGLSWMRYTRFLTRGFEGTAVEAAFAFADEIEKFR